MTVTPISFQEALALHQKGMLNQAKFLYEKLLLINPNDFETLHLLGVIHYQTGAPENAVIEIDKAISIKPNIAAYHYNRGIALKELKKFDEAIFSFEKTISLNLNYYKAYFNKGIILHNRNQFSEAILSFKQAIEINPDYLDAHVSLGNSLHEIENFEEAITCFEIALNINPNNFITYFNLGNAYFSISNFTKSIACYDKAILLNPLYVKAYNNRGNAHKEKKNFDLALDDYDKAISLDSNYAEAYLNKGNLLQEIDKLDDAIVFYNKAITSIPNNNIATYSNKGNALLKQNKFQEAIDYYDLSISLNPNFAEAYLNKGNAFLHIKLISSALENYNKATSLKPDDAELNWNKAHLHLLIGEFAKGWELYEWRWLTKDINKFKRNFLQDCWLGQNSISGKTILIYSEQGLGDTIQFCRYIKMVSNLGAKVIFEVQPPLIKLLKNLSGVSILIAQGDPIPYFDYHCPLMSLPLAFKTDLFSIPSSSYYLSCELNRKLYWLEKFKPKTFKIGICWQGSKGSKIDVGRSFNLHHFEKISKLSNIELISLQKGYGEEQLDNLPVGMKITRLSSEFDSDGAFLDTAAIMSTVDLVITSDTAAAHLAGALGVNVWVVLKFVPEWRWMLDRIDSPWYPSMRLYRQQKLDNWSDVFDQIFLDISLILNTR